MALTLKDYLDRPLDDYCSEILSEWHNNCINQTSFDIPIAILERPAESTAEPSPTYQTTGPFPDSAESRAVAGSTVKFLHQTQLPAIPSQWTEDQVCQWAEWAAKEFQISSLNLQSFRGLSGQQLSSLSLSELESRTSAEYGSTLYYFLQTLKSLSSGESSYHHLSFLFQQLICQLYLMANSGLC
jgi:hypothetical protein